MIDKPESLADLLRWVPHPIGDPPPAIRYVVQGLPPEQQRMATQVLAEAEARISEVRANALLRVNEIASKQQSGG